MTYVIRSGKTFRFVNEADIEVCRALPAGVYTVRQDPVTKEYSLEPLEAFVLPRKLYGDTRARAERVLRTFADRTLSTGVHLDGTKGSGKTLLAKTISALAAEQGIPTIVINQNHAGDGFNQFIQSVDQPAIILFDEFEKVYDWQHQDKILTLLDGVYPTKKLFILTTNEAGSVSKYLKNRPGRIYYSFKYGVLTAEFIKAYLTDNLQDQSQIPAFLKYTKLYSFFNFDMLVAAVEEMNRYGESLQEVIEYLNIKPEAADGESYTISLLIPSANYEKVLNKRFTDFTPEKFDQYIEMDEELTDLEKSDKKTYDFVLKNIADDDGYVHFKASSFSGFDPVTNVFTYTISRGDIYVHLRLTRNESPKFDFSRLAF